MLFTWRVPTIHIMSKFVRDADHAYESILLLGLNESDLAAHI